MNTESDSKYIMQSVKLSAGDIILKTNKNIISHNTKCK
jgi:hypothetical protein